MIRIIPKGLSLSRCRYNNIKKNSNVPISRTAAHASTTLPTGVSIINIFRLRVYPASFAFREDIENGDKILLPASALNELAHFMGRGNKDPMIFCLTNLNLMTPKRTYVGVLEFVA